MLDIIEYSIKILSKISYVERYIYENCVVILDLIVFGIHKIFSLILL